MSPTLRLDASWGHRVLSLTLLFASISATVPAEANPTPDALVYFHVRPAGPLEERCVSEFTDCRDMQPSTDQEGLLEFQIFVDPQQSVHGEVPVAWLITDLSWPETWTLVDVGTCTESGDVELDVRGSNPHRLWIDLDCVVPDPPLLACWFVFDVTGYGRLDTGGSAELGLGCPMVDPVYATSHYAEAGTECEYTDQPCVQWEFRCVPEVDDLQIELSVPEGGRARGVLPFTVSGYPYPRCEFAAVSETEWLTGSVVPGSQLYLASLEVEADASGLLPGVHLAEIQLINESSYNASRVRVRRCVPVTLTVEPLSGVDVPASPDPTSASIAVRLTGPNPSAGPFTFNYEAPTSGRVSCGVYDAAGREVISLIDGDQDAGLHSVTWRADQSDGRPALPGVYLIRWAVAGAARSARVVVVR